MDDIWNQYALIIDALISSNLAISQNQFRYRYLNCERLNDDEWFISYLKASQFASQFWKIKNYITPSC